MANEKQVADAIDRNFTSPNVADNNFECANVVDVIQNVSRAGRSIAAAICPPNVDSGNGATNFSLSEAIMGVSQALNRIADAIEKQKGPQ